MTIRRVIAPLVRGATYRRTVYLLLGGLLFVPFGWLGVVLARLWGNPAVPRGLVLVVTAVAVAVSALLPCLGPVRAVEIALARLLLDAALPDPVPGRIDRDARLRGCVWIGVHLAAGAVVLLSLITVVPVALVVVGQQFGLPVSKAADQPFGPLRAYHGVGWTVTAVLVLIALGYGLAGLGTAIRSLAPTLLGASQLERIAALEAQARELAERARLARELHDSVGHALTVTTLQAAAAGQLLDTDVPFVRQALRAIEETGRDALTELDHVLGVLRASESDRPVPGRTLDDLRQLVAGTPVTVEVRGPVPELPPVVSTEGYRIVQEGLTNAARHAHGGAVRLLVAVCESALRIEVVNTAGTDTGRGGGRGLAGMRERVRALDGSMTAGPDGDGWRVSVRVPVERDGGGP